jgi:hypothetical protein
MQVYNLAIQGLDIVSDQVEVDGRIVIPNDCHVLQSIIALRLLSCSST